MPPLEFEYELVPDDPESEEEYDELSLLPAAKGNWEDVKINKRDRPKRVIE